MNDERQATIIKIAVVCVAMPRWIGALLEGEGVPLPAEWKIWWVVFAALMAAAMAIIEGWAFAYCLRAWRTMTGRASNIMAGLVALSAISFVIVLSPYIAANVAHVPMSQVLTGAWLAIWSTCVALSTILIVASVGYAQKKPADAKQKPSNAQHTVSNAQHDAQNAGSTAEHDKSNAPGDAGNADAKVFVCRICAEGFSSQGKLAAHTRWQHANGNGHSVSESALNAEKVA